MWECFTALSVQCIPEFHVFTYKRVCISDVEYSQH